MSFSVTASFVQQFAATVHHLVQQQKPRLRNAVRVETGVIGNSFNFERLDDSDPVPTTRHGDTYLANDVHDRKTAYLQDFQKGLLVDKLDKIKLLIKPESAYTRNITYAFGRLQDKIVVESLDSGIGAANYGCNLTDANGITFDLVRSVKKFMDSIEVPEEDRFFGYTAETINPLINDNHLTSADYNTVKVLTEGMLPPEARWMGFQWRRFNSSHASIPAANFHNLFAWYRTSVGLAIGADMSVSIDKRPDKQNAWQVWGCMSLGGVMVEPEAIIHMNVASNK